MGATHIVFSDVALRQMARFYPVNEGGFVRISGVGSSWTLLANRIFFGYAAPTSVIVEGGALLDTDTLSEVVIGRYPESAAVVEVRGAGSRWTERRQAITVGDGARLTVGAGATVEAVSLNVLPGGTVSGSGMIGSFSMNAESGERIVTDVFNFGDLSPELIDPDTGAPLPGAAALTVLGNYQQFGSIPGQSVSATGTLTLDIVDGSTVVSDTLAVSGEATLGGGLIVRRDSSGLRGGVPTSPIRVLSADSGVLGFFDVAFLPSVGDASKFFRAEASSGLSERGELLRGPVNTTVVLTVQDLAPINTSANDVDNLGGRPSAAVIGDFDGVNGPDLAVVIPDATNPSGANGSLTILYNNGTSGSGVWNGWTAGAVQYPVGRNPSGIAAGHVDAPGTAGVREDLVISNAADDSVIVLRNNNLTGAGQQFVSPQTFAVGAALDSAGAR